MISIIIPIYNAADYLSACLDSLIAQTEQDLQVVMVDDGSEDKSVSIAQSYTQRDARFVLLQQSHAGQSAARNNGLKHATGDYIAFLDADDSLEADWCERHLAAIEGVDYVQSGYQRVESGTGKVESEKIPTHRIQFTSPCMRLYRREAIEGMRFAEGFIYEDVLWSVDLWVRWASCRRIDYAGYRYTLNPKSTTAAPHPKAQQRVLQALRNKAHKTLIGRKWIVYYTYLRLKAYFRAEGKRNTNS